MPKVKLFVPTKKRSKETQEKRDESLIFRVLDAVGLLDFDPMSIANPLGGIASISARQSQKAIASLAKRLVGEGATPKEAFEASWKLVKKALPRSESVQNVAEGFDDLIRVLPAGKREGAGAQSIFDIVIALAQKSGIEPLKTADKAARLVGRSPAFRDATAFLRELNVQF